MIQPSKRHMLQTRRDPRKFDASMRPDAFEAGDRQWDSGPRMGSLAEPVAPVDHVRDDRITVVHALVYFVRRVALMGDGDQRQQER